MNVFYLTQPKNRGHALIIILSSVFLICILLRKLYRLSSAISFTKAFDEDLFSENEIVECQVRFEDNETLSA